MDSALYNAYTEIYEILSYMPISYVKKIPNELLDLFEQKRNKEYKYYVDTTKKINEQEMLIKTKAILATLYREYWVEPDIKEKILQKEEKERIEYQRTLREIYNPENIFKDNGQSKGIIRDEESKKIDNNDTIEIYRENFFKKFINRIKNIFHLK